jgi:phosphoribosylpyrophosphate synthetase
VSKVYVTDTIPLCPKAAGMKKIELLSVSDLFGEAIRRGFSNLSISSLFDVDKS